MTLKIDAEIEKLQAKKEWILKGLDFARGEGFDPKDFRLEDVVIEAYKSASEAHAYDMGEGPGSYKPVDYDFHYPASDDSFKSILFRLCREKKICPYFDVVKELKKIDPTFDGEGTGRDIFNVMAKAVLSENKDLKTAVDAFYAATCRHANRDVSRLSQIVLDVRRLALV